MRRAAVLLGCLLMTAGCSGEVVVGTPPGLPACAWPGDTVDGGLLLVAQSVPTAQWLPCVRALPVGWTFEGLDAHNGWSEIRVGSTDREGDDSVRVRLERSCDVGDASSAPTDQPGTRRYDRVSPVSVGYRADRYYVFRGGCVTYHIDFSGRIRAGSEAEISAALGMVSRSSVADAVEQHTDGRLTLDPPSGEGSQ
jgi:hypothetical protein